MTIICMGGIKLGADNKVTDTGNHEVVSRGQHPTDDLCCSCIFTNINSSNSQ